MLGKTYLHRREAVRVARIAFHRDALNERLAGIRLEHRGIERRQPLFTGCLADDVHLRNGLNVHKGDVTNAAVARELGYPFVEPMQSMAV